LSFRREPILQATCRIAGNKGFPVGPAAANKDALGPAVPVERPPEEALGRWQIPMFAEPELVLSQTLSMAR
jgi:hypothetical protein